MATTNPEVKPIRRERVVLFVLLGVAAVGLLAALAFWPRPPQMGADEEVFHTVDALFTAITAHDEKRLTECEQRLKAYREAGKLPPDAADSLDGIIAKARAGSWETAAERLYDFMRVQRREGAAEPKPHRHQRKGTK